MSLLFSSYRSELKWIQAQLLQVGKVKLPGEEGVHVIEYHAVVIEETWVVWWNGYWDTLMEEGSNWVTPEVQGVAKNKVADWATFDTNLLFFNELLKVGMKGQVEAVADSFSS